MRFYLLTFTHDQRMSYRGITSATHCIEAINDMVRQGWHIERIQRGTEELDETTLAVDARREKKIPK